MTIPTLDSAVCYGTVPQGHDPEIKRSICAETLQRPRLSPPKTGPSAPASRAAA